MLLQIVGVFLLTYFTYSFAELKSYNEDDINSDGFLFTVPKTLRTGRRETACLSLHGVKSGIRADVTVTLQSSGFQPANAVTKKVFDSENAGCFELRVPETTDSKAKLHLRIKFSNETTFSVNSVEDVNLIQETGVTFIQTDKEVYKPGDRVKIRILLLNYDLTVPKNLVIPIVKIRNPVRIAIGQWENITTELGFIQLEHQLSQETMLGKWIIELPGNNNATKPFEIKEYVLPRFEVIINHPERIYALAKNFNFTVCAKYSYGSAVKGTAHMKILLPSVNQIKELQNGCVDFTFARSEVPIIQYVTLDLQLVATVTEQGTGQTVSTSSIVYISNEEYTLQFINTPAYFQSGIPFEGQVKVLETFKDIHNKSIKICYNVAIGQSWNLTNEQCGHFKLNEKNVTSFVIFPFENDIHSLRINADIEEDANATNVGRKNIIYYSAPRWYSPTNSYLHITSDTTTVPVKCKAWQPFTVLYTLNSTLHTTTKYSPIAFNYLIKSKGNIIKFGKMSHTPCSAQPFDLKDYHNTLGNLTDLKPALPVDKFILTIKIHQKMFAEAQLLVYYVRDDGEVVGSTVYFQVENCLANKVEMAWSGHQNYPGETTNLKIRAASGSLCAVSAVDKKISFLSAPLKMNMQNILFHSRKPQFYDSTFTKCKSGPNVLDEDSIPYWDLRRRKRFYEDNLHFFDTLQVFNSIDLLVMTDLTILTRPCSNIYGPFGEYSPVDFRITDPPAPYQTQGIDLGAAIRSYFPDTWLWELVPMGRNGEVILKKDLPHSVTQWIGNTVCISPSAGLGISQAANITTFKSFFIDLITPYSIKRNEVSHIKVVVYNYLNHSLPVRIILVLDQNFRLAGPIEETSISVCIGPNDSITDTFRVTPLVLGKVNITITAEVDSTYPGECGPEVLLNRRDMIIKSMLVQPEGFPFENTRSYYACTNSSSNETDNEIKWNIELPYDVIKNSSRLRILLDADLLEVTIENLGYLLEIPTGCGEQIMATLAPNLYVLRYLNATGNLTPLITEKALNNIRIGYERIMQYRHRDGSFSAFGAKHGNGSMFLTAFVLRTLSQASKHVFIDKNVITRAASWIIEKQFENGCFPSTSFVFQSAMTENGGDNVALTAYVLISLLESDLKIPETVKNNAKYCLRGYNSVNKYTMAIITYALTLVEWKSEASRSLERLLEVANRQNSLLWWEDPESSSNSLEMTSYMIMSLINGNNSDYIALANEAVRWLLTKRNSLGGFISTQDTVVALDALTKFALVANKEDTNVTVSIFTGGKQLNFRMKYKAKLKTKQLTLTKFSNFIRFKVDGSGCILLQTILRYNMPQIISSEALKLAVTVSPVSTINKCAIARISPCFSYLIQGKQINMAVLEVALPSGYKADRASLYKLTDNTETEVQKFEEVDNKVILYFTRLASKNICAPFLINEQTLVENRTEASVRLFDYYNPELSTTTSYELSTCLSSNNQV